MNSTDTLWMKRAERIALDIEEACSSARVGSILVYKGRELSRGYNRMKSHPLALKWGKNSEAMFIHSELDAIMNASRLRNEVDWRNTTLYVCRVKRTAPRSSFIWGLARPCISNQGGCAAAIAHYDIGRVVYSLDQSTDQLYEDMW